MKRLIVAFCAVVAVTAISVPALGTIIYSGSQNVVLKLGPMSPMDSRTIQLGGMDGDWDDFRVDLWLEMGMPGGMMMSMATKLAIYAPGSMGAGMVDGMGKAMGGILGSREFASNLPMGAMVGGDSFFDVFLYLYGSGEFGEDGGYVGLRTAMGQYGWLHMLGQSDVGTNLHSVVFDGWAYESQPGMPIGVGEGALDGWSRGDPHKMHWPQLPDLGFTGIDVSLAKAVLADDFQCTATGPIRDIHFWGSFLDDILPKEGPDSMTLELSIYSDVPATAVGWSRPGELLWIATFKPGEYTARRVHNGPEDWYDPASGSYRPNNHRNAFRFDFYIERDPFTQEKGKIYWLAVRHIITDDKYTFGWKTTSRRFRWNDDAVYGVPGADWIAMKYPSGHKYATETLDLAFVITDGGTLAEHDLGDAPDSSNSIPGEKMTTYPTNIVANFPTVYQAGSPPRGPLHQYPRDMYYLGKWVSLEAEADVGLDEDGVNNLIPGANVADQDGGDDGLKLPVALPFCGSTTLDYTVTMVGASSQQAYVNVWCDWNRDGDWNDRVTCADGADVPEWAVQNQVIALAGPGMYGFTTPSFRCWQPTNEPSEAIWLRISIAERAWAPTSAVAPVGGVGPAGGYKYGETEDYYIRPVPAPTVAYDFGDAPADTATFGAGYPTLLVDNGARHVIAGPWLGDANDKPDAEADGQPELHALGDDNHGSDDENGVCIPPLIQGEIGTATLQVSGGGGVVQGWIDFNADHAWQATEKVCDTFLPDGVHVIFFTVPGGSGQTFARFRISRKGGLGPEGPASDGEVEDHEVSIIATPDVKHWCQLPDLTPRGIDIRVDNSDGTKRIIADDFGCSSRGRLTHVRLWGSWKDDKKGAIQKIHLRIHPDDPVGAEGADKQNKYSKPGPEILWQKDFSTTEIQEKLFHTVCIAGEWWMDPAANEAIPGGDTQVWQLDMNINPETSFEQEGSADKPMIYWLSVEVEAIEGQFGWKTRQWPEHYMDDATFDTGLTGNWHELRYPHGHEYYDVEKNSIDMSFCLQFVTEVVQPTSAAVALTQCPPVPTTCPAMVTECQAVQTTCPPVATQCPAVLTECPIAVTQCSPAPVTQCPGAITQCSTVETQCPVVETKCPPVDTKCPVTDTYCPPINTKCPAVGTKCPEYLTRCPPVSTKCPPTTTECHQVETQCPTAETKCPPLDTKCPVTDTQCPPIGTKCPVVGTKCPEYSTRCPTILTKCPPTATECQVVETQCPAVETKCPPVVTQCTPTQCVVYTQCPALKTECPTTETQCPVARTECPPSDTYCPTAKTQCPASETVCPSVLTQCPITPTRCPPTPTNCTVLTVCPPSPTACPPVDTQCPLELTRCIFGKTICPICLGTGQDGNPILLGLDCPAVEADCPTVEEYLIIAQAAR